MKSKNKNHNPQPDVKVNSSSLGEGESAEHSSGYSESGKSEEYPSADTLTQEANIFLEPTSEIFQEKSITKEIIGKLKDLMEDDDDTELKEKEEVKEAIKLKKQCSIDDVKKGELVIRCFNILDLYIDSFKQYSPQIKEFLKDYDIEELRILINEYEGGEAYGDYQMEQAIKKLVQTNRQEYNKLIKLFFGIFGEDD